jgi:hypothetical protein
MPPEYGLIRDSRRKDPIKVKYPHDEGNNSLLLMPLSELYPTKMTTVMQDVPEVTQGDLCRYWLKHEGTFIHTPHTSSSSLSCVSCVYLINDTPI